MQAGARGCAHSSQGTAVRLERVSVVQDRDPPARAPRHPHGAAPPGVGVTTSVVQDCDPPARAPVCVLPATPVGLRPQVWGSPPRRLPFLPGAGHGGGLATAAVAPTAVCPSAGIGEGI